MCGLPLVEQADHQEQVPLAENRRSNGSAACGVSVLQDRFAIELSPDLGEGGGCPKDCL